MKRVHTVDHAVKETANAILKAYMRGLIGDRDVRAKFTVLKELSSGNLIVHPEEQLLKTAMEIATRQKITLYDSLYLALSMQKRLSLATLDKQQIKVAEELKIPIISL
ncbi:MAG: type II toxin-antitoxin system VapC family toxin [Candidatus Bathyarchaeia archaeon]